MVNTYEEVTIILNNNHFYPVNTIRELAMNGGKLVGLFIDCPPILMDSRLEKLKSLLGNEWTVYGLPNHDKIHIEKK